MIGINSASNEDQVTAHGNGHSHMLITMFELSFITVSKHL